MSVQLVRHADPQALARAAADEVARRAHDAIAARGAFNLVLAGGSTPRALYRLLADPAAPSLGRIDWPSVRVFFGDERAVPERSPDSNFGMARNALLAHVPVGKVLRIAGERGAADAARHYEAKLRAHFGAVALPVFDLVVLGLGPDGHTASLFPQSAALAERQRWVVAATAGLPPWVERVTLTLPVFDAARAVVFLVAGSAKAVALRQLVRPATDVAPIPAARLRPAGPVLVLADDAASALLDRTP